MVKKITLKNVSLKDFMSFEVIKTHLISAITFNFMIVIVLVMLKTNIRGFGKLQHKKYYKHIIHKI